MNTLDGKFSILKKFKTFLLVSVEFHLTYHFIIFYLLIHVSLSPDPDKEMTSIEEQRSHMIGERVESLVCKY